MGRDLYIAYLNAEVIPKIDCRKLENSYYSVDKTYAKQVLGMLHNAFVQVYGTGCATAEICGEFVNVPAVIRAQKTGEICIGLVTLDLLSSGEHWDTQILTEQGVISQTSAESGNMQDRISRLIPYDYWYTPNVPNDFHVRFDLIPTEVKLMLATEDTRSLLPPPRKRHKGKER